MPPNDALRLVVFDCDGTLVDSQHSIVEAMNRAFAQHEIEPVAAASTRSVIGLPLNVAIAALMEEEPAARHEEIAETYKSAFRSLRADGRVDEPMFEGAEETVLELDAAGWLLGIATGKARRGLDATLGRSGLLDRFVTIQTADVAIGKPHPDMLHRAMAETGAECADTVMIGDTSFDMEMARSAGVAAIGVSWGYHPPEALHASGAHAVIDMWRDLPATIGGIFGRAVE